MNQEKIVKQVQKLLEEKGKEALEMARSEILQEEIECKEVREALDYFMTQYWHDTARPALISLACEVVGGDPDMVIPAAAGMTLISGATDIHDDIIDQSKIKESRPTVLGKFGEEVALLVGDALLFKGFTLLYRAVDRGIPVERMSAVMDIVNEMFYEMGDAEALELKFRKRTDVPLEEYLHVVRKKAADVESCTRLSAIVGGGSDREVEALGEFGRLLGIVLILRDDIADVFDLDELSHRLEKECLPFPVLSALQDPNIREEIITILSKERVTEKDAQTILEILCRTNTLQKSVEAIVEFGEKAKATIKHIRNKQYFEMLIEAIILPLTSLPPDSY